MKRIYGRFAVPINSCKRAKEFESMEFLSRVTQQLREVSEATIVA